MSSNPATGQNMRDQLVYYLNQAQERIALDYNWPGLVGDRDTPLVVGTRYYSYPSDMPFENITNVWLVYNTLYGELPYGIGPQQFALFNSNTGFTSWPVQRWMHHADNNTFELWPVPSQAPAATATSQAALVRMRGELAITPMVSDSDTCVMPATAIVLFAAADILASRGAKDAQAKSSKGAEYLRRLKVRQSAHKDRPFVMGGGDDASRPTGRIGIDYVPQGYGPGP
jgi:hypothetical protein